MVGELRGGENARVMAKGILSGGVDVSKSAKASDLIETNQSALHNSSCSNPAMLREDCFLICP